MAKKGRDKMRKKRKGGDTKWNSEGEKKGEKEGEGEKIDGRMSGKYE